MKMFALVTTAILLLSGCAGGSAPQEMEETAILSEDSVAVEEDAESVEGGEGVDSIPAETVVTTLSDAELCEEYDFYEARRLAALSAMLKDFEGTRIIYSEAIFDLSVEAGTFAGPDGRVQDAWAKWIEAAENFGTVGQIAASRFSTQNADDAQEFLVRMKAASDDLDALCRRIN